MFKKMDKILLFTSLLLFAIGLIMIFSASNVTSFMKYKYSPYYYFYRQLLFLIVSLGLSLVIIRFKTKTYSKFSWPVMFILIGLLVVVLLYGQLTNNARSWIKIFMGIKLQPSEFIKVATIVWMSGYCANIKPNSGFKSYILLFVIVITSFLLILLEPDLGTASIYALIVFLMFTAFDISKKLKRNIFISIGALLLVVVLLLMNNGVQVFFQRQLSRFDYFHPCSEEKFYTTGNQVCNGFIAFNNGNLFGKGLGNSTQKYLYLPEAYTDFIYAIVVEELGVITSIGILLLIFIVLWRIFRIGKKSKNDNNRMICYGVFWYILIHVFINLGGVLGLIPLTGVPLPFMSYGGSFLMCLVVSLTFVQRVAIENNLG